MKQSHQIVVVSSVASTVNSDRAPHPTSWPSHMHSSSSLPKTSPKKVWPSKPSFIMLVVETVQREQSYIGKSTNRHPAPLVP